MSHVFITRSDIRGFECDDLLLPSDRIGCILSSFWDDRRDDALKSAGAVRDYAWDSGLDLSKKPRGFIPVPVQGLPRAWFGWVGQHGVELDWYIERARGFVDAVMDSEKPDVRNGRAKRLLALPLVGTGAGGGHDTAGAILEMLLPALEESARRHDVDIALVCWSEADFSAAQACRRRLTGGIDPWSELGEAAEAKAKALAADAVAGNLVVFFGAGLGISSGLPPWRGLLAKLMSMAGIDDEEADSLRCWSNLDQAQYLERAFRERKRRGLADAVVELLERNDSANLLATYLANLPVDGYITTNYDMIFERASRAIGLEPAVLPYEPSKERRRWLLKMHGCVRYPKDIVLTRRSYNRYYERNQALAGIVQAMLITKRMLFVGFSLGDENFLKIVDTVHEAIHPQEATGPEKDHEVDLGTAILLRPDKLLARHWAAELDLVCPGAEAGSDTEASRILEIFFDYLVHLTASASHLLEPRFVDVLDEGERRLAEALRGVRAAMDGLEDEGLRAATASLLSRFGGLDYSDKKRVKRHY